MANVDFQPQRPHELLGVYADDMTAERVIIDLREHAHVTAIRGTELDEQHSLNAEMREETTGSAIAPPVGVIPTKEAARTGSAFIPVGILIGLVVAMPIAFLFPGELSSGARLAMGGFIGLVFGVSGGLVLTSLGQKRPTERMAAEEGVTVHVKHDTEEVRRLMLAAQPLRLDVVDDQGRPIETLATQGDSSSPREIGRRMNEWP